MDQNSYELTYNYEIRYWWFTARTDIFKRIFQKYKRIGWISEKPNILNLGCGTGIQTETFSRFGNVVSLDFAEEALGFCRKRNLKDMVRADAEKLPFLDDSFDVILCFDILEHLQSDVDAISEMKRVLKPGGVAFISIPAFRFLWSSFDDVNWHKRRYRRKEISLKVTGSGMNIVKAGYFNFFLFPLALIRRFYEKLFKRNKKTYYLPKTGKISNWVFKKIFTFEQFFLPHPSFPFGVSIICIARKP